MTDSINITEVRVGQKIEIAEIVKGKNSKHPDFKVVETTTWTGRVKGVDVFEYTITLDSGTTTGYKVFANGLTIRLLEDVPFADMTPGYYRYYHLNQSTKAVVHFDGTGFGHSDQSPHTLAETYFGYDPVKAETLFERIVQS